MEKIFASKTEGVAEVVEKIIAGEGEGAVLVVPKGAELGESESNFRLLKREADAAGKKVVVESVDENILSMAAESGLAAAHPLFKERGSAHGSALSDIVSRKPQKTRSEERAADYRGRRKESKKTRNTPQENAGGPITLKVAESSREEERQEERQEEVRPTISFGGKDAKEDGSRRLFSVRRAAIAASAITVLGLAWWALSGPFARATVVLDFSESPWSYGGNFKADVSVSETNSAAGVLPAELFIAKRNVTQLFPASGEDEVAEKAKGKIWIYNAFNSQPQVLVATTRFETPDGKIFRIVDRVTVPGAEVRSGEIVPAGIEVDIVADKTGEEYNVNPIPRLAIPGFKGSPRFDGFYGEIKEPTKGGFVGRRPVPTEEDVAAARERTTEILRTSLSSNLLSSYPDGFKVLDEASRFNIVRLAVDRSTDQKGNFSVFGEAEMRSFGFREDDLRGLLEKKANIDFDGGAQAFKELKVSYSKVEPDFENENLSFAVEADGLLWPRFDGSSFEEQVLGRKVDEVQSLIAALEGLSAGRISLWPVWLRSVPADGKKVKIELQ